MTTVAAWMLGVVLLGTVCLIAAWRRSRMRSRKSRLAKTPEETVRYITMCEYGPDGTRWIMRRPVTPQSLDADEQRIHRLNADLPAFLRKQPTDD